MKTTQILAAVFPLAVMAASDASTGTVTATSVFAPGTVTATSVSATSTGSPSTGSGGLKELGCYQISPAKVGDNKLAPDERPFGNIGSSVFNSMGQCGDNLCRGFKYAASQGNTCFCADELDSTLKHITDPDAIKEVCNIRCSGYDKDSCGGKDAITVYENTDPIPPIHDSDYPTATDTGKFVPTTSATNGTATKTGSGSVTTKTGAVEAGANTLVGQSVTMILAVCGLGAALFL